TCLEIFLWIKRLMNFSKRFSWRQPARRAFRSRKPTQGCEVCHWVAGRHDDSSDEEQRIQKH
ncbi:MAG TPA: hypothetical protein VE133_16235, partial [Candidatus Sulfotelmatobacter sp.]|nr:hypothetical protein [Candidatus Sulfotelmatobacter sp.]